MLGAIEVTVVESHTQGTTCGEREGRRKKGGGRGEEEGGRGEEEGVRGRREVEGRRKEGEGRRHEDKGERSINLDNVQSLPTHFSVHHKTVVCVC